MDTAPLVVLQMGDWMGGGWILGLLGMVVFALLVAAVALVFARFVAVPLAEGMDAGDDDAVEVLRRRFARGEIDEEEFERRAESLRRGQ